MISIGIDPGLSGAVAALDTETDALVVFDIPTFTIDRNGKAKRDVDAGGLARSLRLLAPGAKAWVEQVGAMPGQGVSSVFAFGKSYGVIIGVLAALEIPWTSVAPKRWKQALGVPAAKDGARARASQLMPAHAINWTLVKHDGRSEAALIAYYGARESKA